MTHVSHIVDIASVVIPVTDQDRALGFYRDSLGFETRQDAHHGPNFRWLEMALPGTNTTIALVPPRGGMWGSVGIDTRISLFSDDITADHSWLRHLGVDTDAELLRLGPGIPAMFRFRDPDGNTLQIVERVGTARQNSGSVRAALVGRRGAGPGASPEFRPSP